ncbi:ABC transporter ATP-binding protein [Acidisphaera sp. S103]|uniref:ABC transporter ATP-binding protein n=1 Tax=Acidisphaera sp. S103 TaxID=1747223 RepID=UPI00131C9448|nr:sn-glycerol-3-phosphate ABC transporter ATP-binding protein UgpC [Acidisphaera sp. S103]
MATLELRDLRKSFGPVEVVPGVNLDVAEHEFVVLVGPSGCGKSTILRMIAGLEEPTSGDIVIDGAVVTQREPKDRDIAMVFQDYALYPHMTVAENMAFALRYRHVKRADIRRRVSEVARMLEIEPLLQRTPRQLSGGQRQRVAMGRAIVRDPKLFLFDEPLSNLDAKLRVQMRTELRKLRDAVPTTTIYVTHDQVEAMTLADRIVILNHGRIEQIGTPEDVYDTPATAFVASFIGAPAMNLLPARLDHRQLRLEDGTVLPCPLDGARDVLCGIRPESLVWSTQPSGPCLHGTALTVEPLGADTLVTFLVGDTEIAARLPPRSIRRAGEALTLMLDPAVVHVFDQETGQRI